MPCVRQKIDGINTKIVNLIEERLQYVKRAGELKKNTQAVNDPNRNLAILRAVGMAAEQAGYPPQIAQTIFKTILQQSIQYERQFHTRASRIVTVSVNSGER